MAAASTSIRCRRNFESNGPDVKVRGNAAHIAEKYLQLARDAQSSGDSVMAENYLQHAEHYFRIVSRGAAAEPAARPVRSAARTRRDDDDDFPPMNDRFASRSRVQVRRRNQQPRPPRQSLPAGTEAGAAAKRSSGRWRRSSRASRCSDAGAEGDGQPPRAKAASRAAIRDRRPRRRGRGEGGDDGDGADPAGAPQPDVGELPAFLTAGGTTAAE